MKLPKPFFRLPMTFDAERMTAEVDALPESAWSRHPTGYAGNSAVRLVSVNGGENDDVAGGPMQETAALRQSPYLRQVLASFGVVWSRSRLMRLAPGAEVPEHADLSYHWHSRVRVHIPILTAPDVRFHCGDRTVHMAAGEAWIFDNWRLHRVENTSPVERVHLVADTTGSAQFWGMVAAGDRGAPSRAYPFVADATANLALERHTVPRVLPPAEVDQLLSDLAGELVAGEHDPGSVRAIAPFSALLQAFCHDWRQLWMLFADTAEGWPRYESLLDSLRTQAADMARDLVMRTNRMPAPRVLNARLQFALNTTAPVMRRTVAPHVAPPRYERPVFIVAAPRSGSTLLFETLACTPQWSTLGGEAHWLVESFPSLVPGAPGVDSNRLDASHATRAVGEGIDRLLREHLRLPDGSAASSVRFLEKTPKNALRIPFFDRLFPDALFVHLWREPAPNIASIVEAWRNGGWVTYPALPDWDGPWSMLLPPGWRALRGRPLAEVAAFQWESANRIILDDLVGIDPARCHRLSYESLIAAPAEAVRGICAFAGIAFDASLAHRVEAALPFSRHTLTLPDADKWRAHASAIEPLLGGLAATRERLLAS